MPCATICATAIASSPSGGNADSPSPGRSGTSKRYVRDSTSILCAQCRHDPAPPWNSTSTGPLAPRPPHHRSVAARRFRSFGGPFEPVQKCRRLQFDPIVHPVSIYGYSWKARDAAATSSRPGPTLRNTRNHDDCLHRRHPPAMAQRRARPGGARSAAARRDPAGRHPVRPAARRPGGAAAGSRHRRALDLRQPRQRRRPRDVGQPGRARPQSAHQHKAHCTRRVVEIAGVRIAGLGGTFRPRIWEPPESAARASPRATAGGSGAHSAGARSTSPR